MSQISITNLVPTTGWAYSDVSYVDGVFTFSPGVTAMSQVPMAAPTPGHKYYGRVMQKSPAGFTYADHRFEWYTGDTPTGLMCFGRMVDTGDQWMMDSDILMQGAPDEGTWVIRNFVVNGSAACYRKELLIVDLTETFGVGNEPDKAWCDANIPYFTGTAYLAEQPEGFTCLGVTMQATVLAWRASDPGQTFRLYRNDALIYEGTDTHYTDSGLISDVSYSYRITGYNGSLETAGVTLDIRTRDHVWLITDRTDLDTGDKGHYNCLDLIRVNEALEYVADLLRGAGYIVSVNTRKDWSMNDVPTPAEMTAYIQSIQNIKNTMEYLKSTPQPPRTMNRLTWRQANDIEQLLVDAEYTIFHVQTGLKRLGQFDAWCGKDPMVPTAYYDDGRTWEELDALESTWANWQLADWYLLLYGNLKAEGEVS